MEITYLTELNTFNERPFPNEGLSMEQIRDLRDKFNNGKPFPKAFEEFLFIAGDYDNIGFNSPNGLEALQQEVKKALTANNKTIERPYFAFHDIDWNFLGIFLDEDAEDPKVYICEPDEDEGIDVPVIRDAEYSFTYIVNESIRRLKNGTY